MAFTLYVHHAPLERTLQSLHIKNFCLYPKKKTFLKQRSKIKIKIKLKIERIQVGLEIHRNDRILVFKVEG